LGNRAVLTILTEVSQAPQTWERRRRANWLAAIALAFGVSACGGPRGPRTVNNADLLVKIPAIKASVQAQDFSAAAQLIKDLESDDAAVRFYAIGGLQRLTGQDFGYRYYAEETERAEAIGKWKAWLAGWQAAQRQVDDKK
jgi:hypothetical protein